MQKCARCSVEKPLELFTAEGKVYKQCSSCRAAGRARFARAWAKDRPAVEARIKRWRTETNPAAARAIKKRQDKLYVQRHPEKKAAKNRRWRKRNPGKATANTRAYQLRKAMQMPKWADADAIKLIYLLAAQLRAEGHDVEVDHVVPLKGRDRSGLHVADNLQIVPKVFNTRKSNKLRPDKIAA
jgi:hypothetical protein